MEAIIFRNFIVMMDTVTQGNELTIDQRILYRYQASLVIEKSIKIIDQLFEVSGGASVFTGSEIQQRFLDVHTARAHVANNPTSFSRNLGATKLGVDNQDFFI
jgi:3-hydroxy-9,10-secoandrosta-1,3,5(10)-triene-9,17-dione monooxygenase